MAGVGKLAKLLVKMGQKDLVRNFSKAPVKTTLKTAGKALIWPSKKLHSLQGYRKTLLTPGIPFTKADKIYFGGLATATLGLTAGAATTFYAKGSGDEKLEEKAENTTMMGIIGLIAGGPVGAVLGATLGYFGTQPTKTEVAEDEQPAEEIPAAVAEEEPETPPKAVEDAVTTDSVAPAPVPPVVADSIPTDSVTAPRVPVAPTDSVANDSISATRPTLPTDSVRPDSVAAPVVPPLPTDSIATDSIATQRPVAPADSVPTPATPAQPAPTQAHRPQTTEEKLAAQEERIKALENRVAQLEGKAPAAASAAEAPANNIFGGEINEISTKTLKVNIKGDCLWNIAKRELQKANPGKRITNAQILKQVKEFGRINPEIYGENPSLKDLDRLQFGQELKLCA